MPVNLEAGGIERLSKIVVPVRDYKAIFICNYKASLFSDMAVLGYSHNLLVYISLEMLCSIADLHVAPSFKGNTCIFSGD